MSVLNKFKSVEIVNIYPENIWEKYNITKEQFHIVYSVYCEYSSSYDIQKKYIDDLCTMIENYGVKPDVTQSLRKRYDGFNSIVRMSNYEYIVGDFTHTAFVMWCVLSEKISKWRLENKKTEIEILNKFFLNKQMSEDREDKLSLDDILLTINNLGWWL